MASTSREVPPSSPKGTPTINNSTKTKPLENADQKMKKPLENDDHNAAPSSSGTTNKDDHHGGALSPSSDMIHNETPSINNSTKTKSKPSIPSLIENFKANFCISKPKPLENNHRIAASSRAPTNKDDHHGGAQPPWRSSEIRGATKNLEHLKSTFAEAKKYMFQVEVQIQQAHQKFEELQKLGGNQTDWEDLRNAIAKLKFQIPSQIKIRSWPNVNKVLDGMTHSFYEEPRVAHTGGLLEAFRNLPEPLQHCLLCFFKFPPEATIKRMTMVYLWIGQGYTSWYLQGREEEELPREEDVGNEIFDELIEKGFIEPIYRNYSAVPNSCRMSPSIRSSLSKEAEDSGFTSNGTLDLDPRFVYGGRPGHSCMINVREVIISCGPQMFKNMKHIQSLYLGSWQSSGSHRIVLADAKILLELNKVTGLKFLSLRGISKIKELPTFILEPYELKILDLQACDNLEKIPDNIGLLKSLTHLDMSECYSLEHMPRSLAQLSNLEVLKGFFIGEINKKKPTCTLIDLSKLPKLRKLNICTSKINFPNTLELKALGKFYGLQKLTISWGGRSLRGETGRKIEEDDLSADLTRSKPPAHLSAIAAASLFPAEVEGLLTHPPKLQKLHLQRLPTRTLPHWLKPDKLKVLKKLYITGGQLLDLGQFQKRQGNQWNVEILRLKYLSELELDWIELRTIFPKLIYLHQVNCPKFTNFLCDERGVWTNKEAIDTHVRSQLRTSDMISSSSMSGSGPTLAQDEYNKCPVDEKQH